MDLNAWEVAGIFLGAVVAILTFVIGAAWEKLKTIHHETREAKAKADKVELEAERRYVSAEEMRQLRDDIVRMIGHLEGKIDSLFVPKS